MRTRAGDRSKTPRSMLAGVADLRKLREAALETTYVSLGNRRTASPHEFYRYPARFPPNFARSAIQAFTSVGDLVLDPFVGGGTTMVEARLASRPAIGADLNSLAVFVSRVKVRPLTIGALSDLRQWIADVPSVLPRTAARVPLQEWIDAGYLANVDDDEARPIRLVLAKCIETLSTISASASRDFARCAVLRAGQWALDMRGDLPSSKDVVDAVISVASAMIDAEGDYIRSVRTADSAYELVGLSSRSRVIHQGVPGLAERLDGSPAPRLVLTSPPYPGVYVNYHRWKVRGRRETPAPFWLAGQEDGNGLAYYTMSARADRTLDSYFLQLREAFEDVALLCDASSVVVQMVGFHNPDQGLARYLQAMRDAGFTEVRLATLATADDGRLWRQVPNRRWWATNASHMRTASEVVLIHRLR